MGTPEAPEGQEKSEKKAWETTLDEFKASANVQEMPGWRGFMVNGEFFMGNDREKVLRGAHYVAVERAFHDQKTTLPREATRPYPELDARNVLQQWRNIVDEKEGALTEDELSALRKDLDWAQQIESAIPPYRPGLKNLQHDIVWRRERLENYYRKRISER